MTDTPPPRQDRDPDSANCVSIRDCDDDAVNPSRLVARISHRSGPVRLVAIDGPGGSDKSTLASLLSAAANDAPVIHTNDWEFWMGEEDAHFERDPTRERADVVIDG